jgi:type III restriction enzyme
MKQVVIEDPILNSPFEEPRRHFRFDDDGITDEVVCERRPNSYFIPIAKPRKKSKDAQQTFEDWTADRIEENKNVNRIRQRVKLWREGKYPDVTRTTARLLEHWNSRARHRKLFFCQIEALETLVYITEVAKKYADNWIENELRQFNEDANPELFRMACKMATGSGKTAVMSMIIAWHTLNKLANPQGARFTDTVLVVTPGITIKDRLRVLLPSDPQNYYKGLEIVPSDLRDEMGKAKILITNYHAFLRREKIAAGKLTKAILNEGGGESAFTESEARWFAACAGSWAARRTSSCSTTRRTTVTGVAPAPRKSRS